MCPNKIGFSLINSSNLWVTKNWLQKRQTEKVFGPMLKGLAGFNVFTNKPITTRQLKTPEFYKLVHTSKISDIELHLYLNVTTPKIFKKTSILLCSVSRCVHDTKAYIIIPPIFLLNILKLVG